VRQCKQPQCDDQVTKEPNGEMIHANGLYICRKKDKGQLTAAS
jgi:hypothetical protein